MTPVEIGEPNWESFGIRRMDFRPHFDGDLVNVFSAIKPQFTEEMTAQFIKDCGSLRIENDLEKVIGFKLL